MASWITTHAASATTGLPNSFIVQAVLNGALTAKTTVGELLVRRADVIALATRLRLSHCEGCGDD